MTSVIENNEILNAVEQVCEDSEMRQDVAIKLANQSQSSDSGVEAFQLLAQWRASLPKPISDKKLSCAKC